ncbi:MAG: triose-phosphate isomerase, partial [Chloroflexota bacterium]|nr:triose-phosphate isomerase [Chloroflexota bacterium]
MNTTSTEATDLACRLRELLDGSVAEVVVCPPFIWLERVHRALEG